MKKRMIALLLALLMMLLCACGSGGTNEEQGKDTTPAETERRETEAPEETEPVYLCVKVRQYEDGGLRYEVEYEYDEQGYLVKQIQYDQGSRHEIREEYIYKNDENGNRLEVNGFYYSDQDRQGILVYQAFSAYNDDGMVKSTENSSRSFRLVDGYREYDDEWHTNCLEYEHQYRDGSIVESLVYLDGAFISRYEYENGQKVSYEQYVGDAVFMREEYEYRAGSDELTVSREYRKGELLSETKYYYDSYGNLIRTEKKQKDGEFEDEYVTEFEYKLLEKIS